MFKRIFNIIQSRADVKAIIEYLDHCAAHQKVATLEHMLWYVDGKERSIPNADEVNKALKKRPSTFVQRGTDGVIFISSGTDRTVTADDMLHAFQRYNKDFEAAVGKLPIAGIADALKKFPL